MWMLRDWLLNIFFPKICLGCHLKGISLCDKCLNNCRKSLGTPFIYIKSIYNFQDPLIKKSIHAIKYYHRKDLLIPLTKELIEELKDYKDFIFIPIPMSRLKKYIRGYNQAEEIAKILSEKLSIPILNNTLVRNKNTKRQVQMKTRNERLKNPKNSFSIKSGDAREIKDKKIILVDDVITTGATINEVRNVLLKNGAKEVVAITIAH
mgnify:CR=1 FL=1